MPDQLATQLAAADHALEDVIATLRHREMSGFHALHDEEGHLWSGKVDEVQNLRDILRRIPFVRTAP